MMKVTVTFHRRDDLTTGNKEQTIGRVLTIAETLSHTWDGRTLQYFTTEKPSDILDAWECEGFNIDEFEKFSFEGV